MMREHLIERLRGGSMSNADGGEMGGVVATMVEAADEIKRLTQALRDVDRYVMPSAAKAIVTAALNPKS